MIHPVGSALRICKLIQVANLCSHWSMRARLVTDAQEGTILIQTSVGPPVSVIEIEEDFVPSNQGPLRTVGQDFLNSEHLPPA